MGLVRPFHVLLVCSSNAARSIIAEAILNKLGGEHFVAHSAGSQPKPAVDPHALALLERLGHETSGQRPKSWHVFAEPGAPEFDLIITLCDEAAGEACPSFPGAPLAAHWGLADPAAAEGTPAEIALAFDETYRALFGMIELLVALPVRSIDKMSLHVKLREVGDAQRVPAAG